MAPAPATRPAASGSELDPRIAARLKRDAAGLVAAVVQQHDTGQVLMVGWMDDQALHRTLTTGRATYWSRSRQQYWVKGEASGHIQRVVSVGLDCDGDALLVRVDQHGPACHTGAKSCFDAGGSLTGVEPTAAGPTAAKPARAEPTGVELTRADPAGVEPARAEPTGGERTSAEPSRAEPAGVERTSAGSTAEPSAAR